VARTEQLFAEYNRTVSGLCRALLRDGVEAEDAAQQTFLSAHRALLNGTEPREPAAWLATIARNECWSRISTRMREPLAMEQIETASTTNDPLAEAIRRADLAALWRAIEALPRQQRDALLLREFGGLSYGELSAALAVSGAAVESLLFRARQRLRGQLRTVYATLSGASWIETIVRLAAGGSAPVAAKVAALGVGAAVVGSTAVVVPNVLDNHRHSHNTQRTSAAVAHRSKPSPTSVLVEQVVATTTPPAKQDHVTVTAIAQRGSSENDAEQDGNGASQHAQNAQSNDHEYDHATRTETSHGQAGRDGGGDRPSSDQKGDGSGVSSPADGSPDGSPSTTIPAPPAPPPLPPVPGGDGGGD
jgi:RNA polymerase sigma factor (sigma-70 family)